MTKPTIEQIEQCDDLDQLNEWAAVYCMGWNASNDGFNTAWHDNQGCEISIDWQPCSPTTEGKSQCFDLMVKFDMYPQPFGFEGEKLFFIGMRNIQPFNKSELQTETVKAAIISAVSE